MASFVSIRIADTRAERSCRCNYSVVTTSHLILDIIKCSSISSFWILEDLLKQSETIQIKRMVHFENNH